MRHMMKGLLLAAALAASTAALADRGERPDRPPGPPPHEILLENADDIGIDADTQAAIRSLADARRDEAEALHESIRAAETSDEREALIQQEHELGRELMDEIMSMLTEEQQQAAREILPPPPRPPEERSR